MSSSIEIHYRKIRPLNIDALAKQYTATEYDNTNNYNPYALSEIQYFNPLYTDFFVLNDTNYNRVGLNHKYYVDGVSIRSDGDDASPEKTYFVKCSPLLDPVHYLVGKYENVKNVRVLPNLTNQSECCQKILNKNNASYVDGFFSYLSSQLKYKHNMLNAVDFYGSYLAIQKVFKANITDDIDYLHQSNYFNENIGKGFVISCDGANDKFDDFTGIGSRANKRRLVLEDVIDASEMDIDVVDVSDMSAGNAETEDILCEYEKSDNEDDSSVSDESDNDTASKSSSNEGHNEGDDEGEDESENEDESEDESEDEGEDEGEDEEESEDSTESESEAYAYIDNFPTNLIFLEKCDGTLDRLFMENDVNEQLGSAYMMQIIMSLIAFQKAFHFTHNDLHTNNIMYINTDIEFLYYKYDNRFYKVPTYGKIFKLIDFGRAIYRFKNRIYCSDSFAPKGDAHSQYNTEPYFNEKKPRVEPNLSFDLCRLGTSIYDFVIENEDDPRDDFQETIYRWCLDDNGKNIMYRRDGEERYPGFKLYKMIARNVHSHTPQNQLKYPIFEQFMLPVSEAMKLDEQEVRRYGLNLDLVEREYV